jgi:hypothetical protein
MSMTKEQMETVERIRKDMEGPADAPLFAPPAGLTVANVPQGTPDCTGMVATAVERARKDALQEYNMEKAKLDFAAGAAWSIACFGITMVALVAWLGYKRILHPSKLIALGLIVTSALLLIVLGYTDEQMSPVIGLLGTIAGYMLGSKEWDGNDASATSAADDEKARKLQAERDAAEREAAKRGTDTQPQNPDEPVDPEA